MIILLFIFLLLVSVIVEITRYNKKQSVNERILRANLARAKQMNRIYHNNDDKPFTF